MLAIGSSGSGKTNLLTAVIRGLLSWHKDNRSRRPGLLIFDLKGGNFPEQVEEWARREGRADDVVHLSLTSKSGYDLFGTFNTPEQISAQTEKLLFAAGSVSERDQFWDQTRYALIHAALSCLLCVDRERRSFQRWIYLLSSWLTSEEASEEHRELLNQFELHVESMQEADPNRTQLRRAVETLKSWGGGAWDPRTRANIVATTHTSQSPAGVFCSAVLWGRERAQCQRSVGPKRREDTNTIGECGR
ncbi:MAG: hypothetical protein IPN11_15310 [Opitutaceae bacterium]|nr:hypothetical protein [Opitutaceae bacterium]